METAIKLIQDQTWQVVGIIVAVLILLLSIVFYARRRSGNIIAETTDEHRMFISEDKKLTPNLFGMYNVQVNGGEKWLLYRNGQLQKLSNPGPYRWWDVFGIWRVMCVNTHVQLLSFSTKGRIKGPPLSKMDRQITNEEVPYDIEIELGLACKIVQVDTFLSYLDPVSILLAHIKDMVFDLLSDISYDHYGQWANTLRNLVKERLQGYSGDDSERLVGLDSERLVGLRVEAVYLRSFNAVTLREHSMQYRNTASNKNVASIEIFISYAHEDEKWRKELEKQLSNLQNQGLILNWHDRQISAGTEWEHEIKKHLENAQIILLLISPDFMASKFCYSIELQQAIKRHNRREAHVIPVILRSVDWKGAPFAKLQVLPTDAKPILSSHWHNIDEAFLNVAQGIRKAIVELNAPS